MYRKVALSLSSCIILGQLVIHSTLALQCYECEEVRHIDGEWVSGNCSMQGGARIMTHCLGRCGKYVWYNRKFIGGVLHIKNEKKLEKCSFYFGLR